MLLNTKVHGFIINDINSILLQSIPNSIVAGVAAFEVISRWVADTLLPIECNVLLIFFLGFSHLSFLSVNAFLVILLFPPLYHVPDEDFLVEVGKEWVDYDDAHQDHFELVGQRFKLKSNIKIE